MSQPRRARRIDDNQRGIVKALRDIPGVTVEPDHDDILVGYRGVTYWFEVKRPEAVSRKTGQVKESEIKPSEAKRLKEWKGHYAMVWDIKHILEAIGI